MSSRILFNQGNVPFQTVETANNTAALLSTETGRHYVAIPYGDGYAIQCNEHRQSSSYAVEFGEITLRPAWRSLLPELFFVSMFALGIMNIEMAMSWMQIDVLQSALYRVFNRTFSWNAAAVGLSVVLALGLGLYVIKILAFRYSHWYFIGPKGVESNVGIISKDQTRIEYKHARGANMQQTILGRIIGYGTVVIPTSGSEEVCFKDVANPSSVLNELRKRLRELA